MAAFDPQADQEVRAAVDDYLAGRRSPSLPPEGHFETRNSRYAFRGGRLTEAPDRALLGCEMVGWLQEAPGIRAVVPVWVPGARAVLVDRRGEAQIIVTSGTRALRTRPAASCPAPAAGPGSRTPQPGSAAPQASRRPSPPPPPFPGSRLGSIPPAPPLPGAGLRAAAITGPLPPPRPLSIPPMPMPRLPSAPPPPSLDPSPRSARPAPLPPLPRTPSPLPPPPSVRPLPPPLPRLAAPSLPPLPPPPGRGASVPPAPPSADPFPLQRPHR